MPGPKPAAAIDRRLDLLTRIAFYTARGIKSKIGRCACGRLSEQVCMTPMSGSGYDQTFRPSDSKVRFTPKADLPVF